MSKTFNARILLSFATLLVAAAIIIGATFAFFSDTETSQGNTFTAGKVDLKIDSECSFTRDGQQSECVDFGSWDSIDLTDEKFFNFTDVKPGDFGENTISLTVDNNDAYACLRIDNMDNLENTIIDPEAEAGDVTDPEGELAQNLHFTAWLDQGNVAGWQNSDGDVNNNDEGEGDNIWQGSTAEPLLFSNEEGPASDVLGGKTYPLSEPPLPPIEGNVTNYIGLQWCAGDMVIASPNITCDGESMGNESQTDSLSADMHFYAVQSRNNDNFSCEDVVWPSQNQ